MKLILSCHAGSAAFTTRTISLAASGGEVNVLRSSPQQKPSDSNAIFECKVLSRSHALIYCSKGKVYLKDNASRNGSFINNHRLIKDFKESQETQLFTNDIIRFGAQVRDDATVLEKCIIAKLKILNDRGTDVGQRPDTDRLKNNKKNENFSKQVTELEEKLKSEQNESLNLREMLKNAKKTEDQMKFEIKDFSEKFESSQRQINDQKNDFNSKLEEKELLLDKQIGLLKSTTEDLAKVKGDLTSSKDANKTQNMKIENLERSISQLTTKKEENEAEIIKFQAEVKKLKDENTSFSAESKKSAEEATIARESLKLKVEEISQLKSLVDKDENELKEKTGAYNDLENLMTEEDETLKEAEDEIRKLLEIIAENQEIILNKDKTIIMLQNVINEKEEFIKVEMSGTSKKDLEKQFNEAIDKKNLEIDGVKAEMKVALENLETNIHRIEKEMEINKDTLILKDSEIDDLNEKLTVHTKQTQTHEALKVKCEELMKIIMKQNTDMEKLKNDVAIQDAIVNRNETLQKEVLIMKVGVQQKDVELQNFKELLASKDKTIAQIKKLHVDSDKEHGVFREMSNLMTKIIKEQEINEQSENEIIQLRIELDNIRRESGHYGDMTQDEHIELLQMKDEELDGLKTEIMKEQQINSHIVMVQEKDILEKDRAITFLNKQLTIKQKENDCLRKLKVKGNSRERSVTVSPHGEDTDTIEQNTSEVDEDDFIFVEDLKNDEEKNEMDNVSLG